MLLMGSEIRPTHQLRLVVEIPLYPIIYHVFFYIPNGARFQPSTSEKRGQKNIAVFVPHALSLKRESHELILYKIEKWTLDRKKRNISCQKVTSTKKNHEQLNISFLIFFHKSTALDSPPTHPRKKKKQTFLPEEQTTQTNKFKQTLLEKKEPCVSCKNPEWKGNWHYKIVPFFLSAAKP